MLNKAVINLKTLIQNVKNVKKKIDKGTLFCAVVKADAYGHGIERVANAVYPYVDCYAVALVEEGVKLRLSGIDKDVLVLTPPQPTDIETGIKNGFIFAVDNLKRLIYIDKKAKELKIKARVHIKYNTGMNRFGIDSIEELKKLLKRSKKLDSVSIEGLFSHYATPENKKSLESATNKFLLAIKVIKSYNINAICHISASGGFIQGKNFDMVRIGILLYGYLPFPTDFIKVKPIMKIKVPVLRQREIKPFDKCLYGEKTNYVKRTVSLVRFGYADGLNRRQTNGQFNNRCMDVTMLTDLKKRKRVLTVDSVDGIAKNCGTIHYEILTKIAMRAEKIYKN